MHLTRRIVEVLFILLPLLAGLFVIERPLILAEARPLLAISGPLQALDLLLDLLGRMDASVAEIDFLALPVLLGPLRPEQLDVLAKLFEHLERRLDGLALPAAPALFAVVVILQLENLLRERPPRHDRHPLDCPVKPHFDCFDLGESRAVLETLPLLASRDHADYDAEDDDEGEGTKENSQVDRCIYHKYSIIIY